MGFLAILIVCDFFKQYLENQFDPIAFETFLNELMSSDPFLMKEQSVDLPIAHVESEPSTREMGTDPMEPVLSAQPITITTTNLSELTNGPIFLIRTTGQNTLGNTLQIESVPISNTTTAQTEMFSLQFDPSSTISDYQMEDHIPLTPSSSSNDSPDENLSNSPDGSSDNLYSKLLTNLDVSFY